MKTKYQFAMTELTFESSVGPCYSTGMPLSPLSRLYYLAGIRSFLAELKLREQILEMNP